MYQHIGIPKELKWFIAGGPQIIWGVMAEGQGQNVQAEAKL